MIWEIITSLATLVVDLILCLFHGCQVKRIFVGGLSSDSSEEDLRDYFETFGKVSDGNFENNICTKVRHF